MSKEFIFTDIHLKQSAKKKGNPCGDVFDSYRDALSTTLVLCDGLGSGLKANIYASMICSRIINLLKNGAALKTTFEAVGKTMNEAWGKNEPFAVFTIARVLHNGNAHILSYEMPAPILISDGYASILNEQVYPWKKAIVHESSCTLGKNEGILLMSDGITQAGLGQGMGEGWEAEGVERFLNHRLQAGKPNPQMAVELVHAQALKFWGPKSGDDCSLVCAFNRKGITVNLLTGPPFKKNLDTEFVARFSEASGIKIVCGGSSAKMIAREMKQTLELKDGGSALTPPEFSIKGITLATEGIVTLNQVYNILEETIERDDDNDSPVFELAHYLSVADKVTFFVGSARNIGEQNIELRQQGIQSRQTIVKLLAEKLRLDGKLVIVEEY